MKRRSVLYGVNSSLASPTGGGRTRIISEAKQSRNHGWEVLILCFDPRGSSIPLVHRWERDMHCDHYAPAAASGAVELVCSTEDMKSILFRGLTSPRANKRKRRQYIDFTFGGTLDGCSGKRLARVLNGLATGR